MSPKRTIPLFWCVATWLILVELNVLNAAENEDLNLALHKPVYAIAQWAHCLVDGKYGSTISPYPSTFPAIVVDLLDVYNLSSIHVHAQNEPTFYDAGLNVPFSVYTWDKPTSHCDFEKYYPWNPVQKNLTFKTKGEDIELRGNFQAQYIIVLPDFDDPFARRDGLTMGELRAFGKKIRDGFKPIPPDNGTYVTSSMEIRDGLLRGQGWINTEFGRMTYILNPNRSDVAVVWHEDRIAVMASQRQKARLIGTFGVKPLARLLNASDHKELRNNIRHWLSNQSQTSQFVNVTSSYAPGDILVISPFDRFDVDTVYKQLIQGNNSALVAYTNEPGQTANDLPELLEKLEVRVKSVDQYYGELNFHAGWFTNNRREVPIDHELQVALNSWQQFRTQHLNFGHLTETQLETPQIQHILRQVLDKYYEFFTHYAPCRTAPYNKHPDTEIALQNYNKLLLMQRGVNILVAPGVWGSPGGVYPTLKPSNYTVRYKIDIRGDYFPTAGYAKPGEPFYYEVLNHSHQTVESFRIQINPQVDEVGWKWVINRWPKVWLRQTLKRKGHMVSPFGGPIVIAAPDKSELTIRFRNVYRYPWFDVRDPNAVHNWESQREKYKGTPYGMIMGDNMISMLESPALLRMDAQTILWSTRYFDNIVKMMHNYRGTKFEDSRIEVFVTDDDITNGYGHSGYPWMGYRDWASSYDSIESIKRGQNIGYPHELGHNLQVHGMTFKNGEEVTNNMYIPVVHKYLLNLSSYSKGAEPGWSQWDEKSLIENWKSGEYRGVQVSYYNYFGRLFSPALVGNVIPLVVRTQEPLDTEERKVNFWIKNMCNESRHDLVPFHRLWHFPINNETVEFCSQFPCVFPDDELTQQVSDLVEKILIDSGKQNCSRTKPDDVTFKNDPMRGMNKTKPQSIFITED